MEGDEVSLGGGCARFPAPLRGMHAISVTVNATTSLHIKQPHEPYKVQDPEELVSGVWCTEDRIDRRYEKTSIRPMYRCTVAKYVIT